MSAPSLFKTSMKGYIQQESVSNYHKQLAEKKAYLEVATECYKKSLDLADQLKQKISLTTQQLELINNQLAIGNDESEVQKLKQQKIQYEGFITHFSEKIAPYTQRLAQLADEVQTLTAQITAIEEQVRIANESSILKMED